MSVVLSFVHGNGERESRLVKLGDKAGKNVTGRRIREARYVRPSPISQISLSRKLGKKGVDLDQAAISRIENEERLVTDYELIAISRCLNVSVGWLCREKSKKYPHKSTG